MADRPGDDRRGCRVRRGVGRDPGRPAGLRPHERDHHLADAQLRGGARPQLPDLRQPLVLARHVGDRAAVPAGQGPSGRGRVADVHDRLGVRAVRVRRRDRRRDGRLGALFAHPVRLRDAGDRRLARGRALRRDADAAEDRRRALPLGCDRGDRRCEPGRRLPSRARRARAAAGELRLHRDRRRRARTLQPVRHAAGRLPARGAAERRLHAPGRGLPVGPRRRDAGDDPLRGARR